MSEKGNRSESYGLFYHQGSLKPGYNNENQANNFKTFKLVGQYQSGVDFPKSTISGN